MIKVDVRPEPDIFLPYRLRTVRLGVQATWMVVLILPLLFVLRHRGQVDPTSYFSILAVAGAGGLLIRLLPWTRLFERGLGFPVMYAWSAMDIVLITLLLGVVGPDSVDMFVIYALTTVFFAASYPPRGQVALLLFTYACYLTLLAATGWPVPPGNLAVRLGILGTMTFLAGFLSSELMRQMQAHHDARQEADRRAALLRTVAGAARTMSFLDSDRVLASVVDSALSLGFEAGEICFYEEGARSYRVAHPRGVPSSYAQSRHSADTGIVSLVLEQRATVMMDDYRSHPRAVPWVRDAGFRAVIGSPVWSQGRLSGALIAGTRHRREVTELEREAFELLAAQAGRALENAEQFEAERQAVERMAELDRMKQDFLSSVSHEIRTPLTVIEGNGLTLEEHWDRLDDRTRREFLASMNANSKALDGIVSKLLDFSRLETGKLEIHPRALNIRELFDHVVSRLGNLADQHMILVEAPPDLEVTADPLLVDRVIENLVSNALKYTPPGTGILISASPAGERAVITVTDHGPGIPPDEVARLGERFFRGGDPNARPAKGIGLGLALAREFLQLHASELRVESTMGSGSRFWFSLPLARVGLLGPAPATNDVGTPA